MHLVGAPSLFFKGSYITTPLSRCSLTLTDASERTLPLFPEWPQLKSRMKALLFNRCISACFLGPLITHSSLTEVQFIDGLNIQTRLTHHIAFLYFPQLFVGVSLSPSYPVLGKHCSFSLHFFAFYMTRSALLECLFFSELLLLFVFVIRCVIM